MGKISRHLIRHLTEVFAYYPTLIINYLHLYRDHTMTKFTFFLDRAERWKKDLVTLWGNLEICPCLDCLELPSHSPVELTSVSRFKVWGNTWDPCQDMAYLLVCLGNTIEGIQYSVSLVWVNPKQARAPTMEEAVEKLAAYPSGGTDWPYILAHLYEGSGHAVLPKGKHLGILLKERWRKPPVGRSASSMSANSFLLAPKWSIPQV